jgi:hypothetical protein
MANRKLKRVSGINGWLLIILIDFILSAISSTILLYSRVNNMMQGKTLWGIYISSFILLFYLIFLVTSILFIILKKKSAIKTAGITFVLGIVFAVWYYILSKLIFDKPLLIADLFLCLIDLAVIILMIFYFKKSKRVKNTLIK